MSWALLFITYFIENMSLNTLFMYDLILICRQQLFRKHFFLIILSSKSMSHYSLLIFGLSSDFTVSIHSYPGKSSLIFENEG